MDRLYQSGEQSYLRVTVKQPDRLVGDLQEHLLRPDFILRVQKNQLLDRIIHCDNRLCLVHNERGEMLRRRQLLVMKPGLKQTRLRQS